jgi:hypothetical protein
MINLCPIGINFTYGLSEYNLILFLRIGLFFRFIDFIINVHVSLIPVLRKRFLFLHTILSGIESIFVISDTE